MGLKNQSFKQLYPAPSPCRSTRRVTIWTRTTSASANTDLGGKIASIHVNETKKLRDHGVNTGNLEIKLWYANVLSVVACTCA